MKLRQFRVTNFRSVIDSGWIDCDDVTTLVGINESGKSNILLALWKLNPVRDGKIDILHDLPVSKLADLRDKSDETCFIEAVFTLEESAEVYREKYDVEFEKSDEIIIQRYYAGDYNWKFADEEKEEKIRALTKPTKDDNGEKTEPKFNVKSITDTILAEMPGFVYYCNYGNLASEVYLPFAVKWLKNEIIPGFPVNEAQIRTLRVLFEYVNLDPNEILQLGKDAMMIAQEAGHSNQPTKDDIEKADRNKEKRSILLQSAGAKLTNDFKDWWKQGNYTFSLEADGDYFRIWVSDEKRPAAVPLELRSTGLQWFLSFFLVFLVECRGENKNAVLLLDEAGLTLHPLAQKDLSIFFKKLAKTNPIINSTHSPFIVDTDHIDRCRVVYSNENGETVVSENLREGSGDVGMKSIYAVHAALGLSVSDVMLQGSQVVIVEGPTDQYYLSAIKNVLIHEGRIAPQKEIVFAPAGGVKGVPGITSLVAAKNDDLPYVILDSDESGKSFKDKLLKGTYKDCVEKIISVSDYTLIDGSEIEDLIPYELIERKVQTLLNVEDDEDDPFKCVEDKPILTQIDQYAREQSIKLPNSFKIELARAFTKKIYGKKKLTIPSKYLTMWEKLFKRLQE